MIEQDFYQALSSSTQVAALTGSRVYPLLVPQDSTLPAIDYIFVGGTISPTFDTPGTAKYRIEVNCWGDTYLEAVTVRAAVIQALNGYRSATLYVRLIQPRDMFDHELLQYRAMVEFYAFQSVNIPSAPQVSLLQPDVPFELTAAIPISAFMVVAASTGKVSIADCTNLTQLGDVVGIAVGGAVAGSPVNIQYSGTLTHNGWNWTPRLPIFLGTNGALTQTPPVSGFLQGIATPLSATSLLVTLSPPLLLA